MEYKYVMPTTERFVHRLAANLLPHGYWFYVAGAIPIDKDPEQVDAKLLNTYDINCSRWTRTRRKQQGLANVHYVRHERFFLLLASHGEHLFFEREAHVRDVRKYPIKFGGYSISFRGGHSHVRIEEQEYRQLKRYVLGNACHWSEEEATTVFMELPYRPYAPVRRQVLNLCRGVNRARKVGGLPVISTPTFPLPYGRMAGQ